MSIHMTQVQSHLVLEIILESRLSSPSPFSTRPLYPWEGALLGFQNLLLSKASEYMERRFSG